MKNARVQRAAAALMMAAAMMISAGSAEAKKHPARGETPPAVVSTESRGGVLRPATRYPEDPGIGRRLSIERGSLWQVLGHLYWN